MLLGTNSIVFIQVNLKDKMITSMGKELGKSCWFQWLGAKLGRSF